GPYLDYRANLHVHSLLSHDSRGTIEEIVAAAKVTGTRVLMFTEHPSERYDYFKDGHQGMKDGVLLIPGAETNGFLVFPKQSLRGLGTGTPQEFCDLVRGRERRPSKRGTNHQIGARQQGQTRGRTRQAPFRSRCRGHSSPSAATQR